MKKIKTEKLFVVEEEFVTEEGKNKNGFFDIKRLTLENKGQQFTRDQIISKDAVAAVVYDEKLHKYVFTKQFRTGPEQYVVELVAGLIEHGMSPKDTMIAEIKQEIGYKVDTIELLCNPFFTTPGKTNEKIYLYYVTVSEQESEGGGLESENEDIEVLKVYQNDIRLLKIEDGKTLIGLYKLNLLQ